MAQYTITAADRDKTVTDAVVATALDVAGFVVSSKRTSAAVSVSPTADTATASLFSGSNSNLLLIAIATFVAAVGLLVLAGTRRERPTSAHS